MHDARLGEVWVYRYRCCSCRRTFRHYPIGIDRASQTHRMRALAAMGWLLGMSYRGISIFLDVWVKLERMSIWRDVQQRGKQLEKDHYWKPVRVAGLDGAYVRGWGKIQPVLVAVDMGTGKPITVGYVDEKDPQAVKKFLKPLVQRPGISVTLAPSARAGVVTDDLISYRWVAYHLGLEQQVCQFHLRRWVGRTLMNSNKPSLPNGWG